MLSGGTLDTKKLLMAITGIVRLYALKYRITGFSTLERILELHAGKYMDAHFLRDSIKAWKNLTSLRLSHQASCIEKGSEPDNRIDLQLMDSTMRCFAEQAIVTINSMMLKAGRIFIPTRFRIYK